MLSICTELTYSSVQTTHLKKKDEQKIFGSLKTIQFGTSAMFASNCECLFSYRTLEGQVLAWKTTLLFKYSFPGCRLSCNIWHVCAIPTYRVY